MVSTDTERHVSRHTNEAPEPRKNGKDCVRRGASEGLARYAVTKAGNLLCRSRRPGMRAPPDTSGQAHISGVPIRASGE